MKRILACLLLCALTLGLCACTGIDSGSGAPLPTLPATTAAPEMVVVFMSSQTLLGILTSESTGYILLDVRAAEDYAAGHIKGAFSAPVTHSENSDDPVSTANLQAALKAATGDAGPVPGLTYVVLCYKGGAFAKKATELLRGLGFGEDDNLLTLDGGYQTWSASGAEYADWVE